MRELSRKHGAGKSVIGRKSIYWERKGDSRGDTSQKGTAKGDSSEKGDTFENSKDERVWRRNEQIIFKDWEARLRKANGDKGHPCLAKPLKDRLRDAKRYFFWHIHEHGYGPKIGGPLGVQG
jgi:hypothetical protein